MAIWLQATVGKEGWSKLYLTLERKEWDRHSSRIAALRGPREAQTAITLQFLSALEFY